jgi:hypothetical protein
LIFERQMARHFRLSDQRRTASAEHFIVVAGQAEGALPGQYLDVKHN